MLRVVQQGHRHACFEPDPDKAPLVALCPECRAVLEGFASCLRIKADVERERADAP